MIKAQTLQPVIVEVINDQSPELFEVSDKITGRTKMIINNCDITWRYRLGYERLRGKGIDMIALMENDDWYSPLYLEMMAAEWLKKGRPYIMGHSFTTYYNIKIFKYFNMNHRNRSSAMNTFIRPDMNLSWGPNNDPYTDMWLWLRNKDIIKNNWHVFTPSEYICIGIKHGEGLCGGIAHALNQNDLKRFINNDTDKRFLNKAMQKDEASFEFYSNYFI